MLANLRWQSMHVTCTLYPANTVPVPSAYDHVVQSYSVANAKFLETRHDYGWAGGWLRGWYPTGQACGLVRCYVNGWMGARGWLHIWLVGRAGEKEEEETEEEEGEGEEGSARLVQAGADL